MDIETFQQLPTAEIARLVRETGPKVCGFPINGTRRWFALEYPDLARAGRPDDYISAWTRRYIEIYRLIFDHGIDTLLTPIVGPDILQRGAEYSSILELGLMTLAQSREMLEFYDAYDVRVRVYGDARRWLQSTLYAHLLDAFDAITKRTATHQRYRLFFGVCAHDSAETVAEIGVAFQAAHGCLPNKTQIVEAYYGEGITPLNFFIGFGPPAVFDVPLLDIGNTDLYFTVSPSLYLANTTLRAILYDHLYVRQVDEDFGALTESQRQDMAEFYHLHRRSVLGLGRTDVGDHFWYPGSPLKD